MKLCASFHLYKDIPTEALAQTDFCNSFKHLKGIPASR